MDPAYIIDMFTLKNKVAVITGASKGLGQSMALALGKAGARVCLVGRQPNLGQTENLLREYGCETMQIICNQTTDEGVSQIIDSVRSKWGELHILVNNAGTFVRKPSIDWMMEEWDEVMAVNLRSVFRLSQEAGKLMLQQRSGKIIMISSVLGYQGGLTVPAYTASRHGVIGLIKALSNEWASYGINVNGIAPGYMDTDQNIDLIQDPNRSRELMARIPAQRWGKQQDIDGACLYLASAASDYMHGQVIVVDGGWLGR